MEISWDLKGKVHQAIENNKLFIKSNHIQLYLSELKDSLKKAQSFVQIVLFELNKVKGKNSDPETGKIIFYRMELEALKAYSCFIQDFDQTLKHFLKRKYRSKNWGNVDYKIKWDFLYSQWVSFDQLIKFCLDQFV